MRQSVRPRSVRRSPGALHRASIPHAQVPAHNRRDVHRAQQRIGLKGRPDAPNRAPVRSLIGQDVSPSQGAQRLGDPRRRGKRGDAVADQEARDRGVGDPRAPGEAPLAQAPGAQLGAQPAGESSRRRTRIAHACSRPAPRVREDEGPQPSTQGTPAPLMTGSGRARNLASWPSSSTLHPELACAGPVGLVRCGRPSLG